MSPAPPASRRNVLRTLWLAMGWVLVLAVLCLSLAPIGVAIPGAEGDKVGHLLAYSVLMLWFAQVYVPLNRRLRLALALFALGIFIEIMQYFLPYRSFDLLDMAADATGIALGWIAAVPRTPNFLHLAQRMLARS